MSEETNPVDAEKVEETRSPEEIENAIHEDKIKAVTGVLEQMKADGVLASIQFKRNGSERVTHLTTMNIPATLGALEFAKLVTQQGLQQHLGYDIYVQTMETQPELVRRMIIATKKVEDAMKAETDGN